MACLSAVSHAFWLTYRGGGLTSTPGGRSMNCQYANTGAAGKAMAATRAPILAEVITYSFMIPRLRAYRKTTTVVPRLTRAYRSIISALCIRMQPCDTNPPTEPGLLVPWMAYWAAHLSVIAGDTIG